MNEVKKILVSDYDQTFYISDEDIEKNIIAVNEFRKRGNIFVIATGRSYFDFKSQVNLYCLKYDYVILNHGTTILDNKDNIISNFSIKNEIIESLKNDLDIEKSVDGFCCSRLESRVDFDYKDLTKINIKYDSENETKYIYNLIKEKYSNSVELYYVNNKILEIISNKINKSKAISLLLNKLNMVKDNVYTIGDGYNDIEMIKDFNGYAMKNAVEDLKLNVEKEYNSVFEFIYEIMINN